MREHLQVILQLSECLLDRILTCISLNRFDLHVVLKTIHIHGKLSQQDVSMMHFSHQSGYLVFLLL